MFFSIFSSLLISARGFTEACQYYWCGVFPMKTLYQVLGLSILGVGLLRVALLAVHGGLQV